MIKTRIINGRPTDQTYTDEWLEENKDVPSNGALVSDWVTAPLYKGNFIIPYWDGVKYIESATPAETQLHLIQVGKESVKKAYTVHRIKGKKYAEDFEDYLAEHVLIYQALTETQALSIGRFVYDPLLIVARGQWKSAIKEIKLLEVTEGYMQPFIDKLKADIEVYITNNYKE